MEHEKRHASRRGFLKGWLQRLVATPVAIASVSARHAAAEPPTMDERDERLPGDPGYRDPDTYGNVADYLAD